MPITEMLAALVNQRTRVVQSSTRRTLSLRPCSPLHQKEIPTGIWWGRGEAIRSTEGDGWKKVCGNSGVGIVIAESPVSVHLILGTGLFS